MMELEEARAHVNSWLDEAKLKTGKVSELMRNEIAEGMRQRTISAFAVYDEIGQLEQSDPPRSSGTKPAKPLAGELLAGLMHKHYKTASMHDFILNLENHWKRPANRAERRRIENEVMQGGHIGKAAHEIVLGGYEGRHGAAQMTGEWIVYAVVHGVNYYLTLATHGEDSAVRERVIGCFAEFPKLQAQLGWEDEFKMAKCPLCGNEAKKLPSTGDWSRYDCPTDKLFDITGTAEAEIRNTPDLATSHRERITRERAKGIKIPMVGIFPPSHQ